MIAYCVIIGLECFIVKLFRCAKTGCRSEIYCFESMGYSLAYAFLANPSSRTPGARARGLSALDMDETQEYLPRRAFAKEGGNRGNRLLRCARCRSSVVDSSTFTQARSAAGQ